MSTALEFAAPLGTDPAADFGFNRNIRKFRVLQAKFADSNTFEPLVIPTIVIDPLTQRPQRGGVQDANYWTAVGTAVGTPSGTAIIINGDPTKTRTILKFICSTAGSSAGSITCRFANTSIDPAGPTSILIYLGATQQVIVDFGPTGFQLQQGQGIFADTSGTSTGNFQVWGMFH